MLKATVSGSFHRHMHKISQAVIELRELGVRVFSPADPRVVDHFEDFLFVASDIVRSIRLVQDRHLESIRASNFLWLVAPDGYVGQSASMELGFAIANSVPIFSSSKPSDLTIQQYTQIVPNLRAAVDNARSSGSERTQNARYFLIDPHASFEAAHTTLERMEALILNDPRSLQQNLAHDVYSHRDRLIRMLAGPCRKEEAITV